jgi:hypothetical protein
MASKYDDALAKTDSDEFESEIDAIRALLKALTPLTKEARLRVIAYSFKRLGLEPPESLSGSVKIEHVRSTGFEQPIVALRREHIIDIRTLTEEKKPSSAREMAVLVAYYLSEQAPPDERKNEINADDIRQYFKQGGFKLPTAPEMTLVHTRNAGYLDSGSQRGLYKLNPVGYNLVVHSLPGGTESGKGRSGPSRGRNKSRR